MRERIAIKEYASLHMGARKIQGCFRQERNWLSICDILALWHRDILAMMSDLAAGFIVARYGRTASGRERSSAHLVTVKVVLTICDMLRI